MTMPGNQRIHPLASATVRERKEVPGLLIRSHPARLEFARIEQSLQSTAQHRGKHQGTHEDERPLLDMAQLQMRDLMRGDPFDLALRQMLQQIIREHHDTVAGRKRIRDLPFTGWQNEYLLDTNAGFVC